MRTSRAKPLTDSPEALIAALRSSGSVTGLKVLGGGVLAAIDLRADVLGGRAGFGEDARREDARIDLGLSHDEEADAVAIGVVTDLEGHDSTLLRRASHPHSNQRRACLVRQTLRERARKDAFRAIAERALVVAVDLRPLLARDFDHLSHGSRGGIATAHTSQSKAPADVRQRREPESFRPSGAPIVAS